jgi:hypothetical protein
VPNPGLSRKDATDAVRYVSLALADGFKLVGQPSAAAEGWRRFCKACKSKIDRRTFNDRLARAADLYGLNPKAAAKRRQARQAPAPKAAAIDIGKAAFAVNGALRAGPKTVAELSLRTKLSPRDVEAAIDHLRRLGSNVQKIAGRFDIPQRPRESYISGAAVEIVSRPDNSFVFGAFGDLHAASKHTRWDVREDLVRLAEAAGAQAIMDTGNWIDAEATFNRYDLEVVGLEQQCRLLAKKHPRTALPIYAVTGDDHEGWYEQRDGIDVGKYNANIMREAGHDWHDLGFMEAHITLRNANSGKKATLAVVHPGGGSAYALSYSIQKIVESYEGGEKPHVAFYGHYHKLWAGIIRNIWCLQTGTQQDQTPFMRKKRLEAHVGGAIVTLRQDPRTGAIVSMLPDLRRYFNKGFYKGSGRWSHHGAVVQPRRSTGAIRA